MQLSIAILNTSLRLPSIEFPLSKKLVGKKIVNLFWVLLFTISSPVFEMTEIFFINIFTHSKKTQVISTNQINLSSFSDR